MDEHKKFWVTALGGTLVRIGTDNSEIVKFHNALLFMRAQKPTGGTKGSTFDHVGLSVPNLRQVVDRIKANGYRMVTAAEAPPNIKVVDDIGVVEGAPVTGIAYAMGPDDVKVEIVELKAQTVPVASHHLHFMGPNKEMQAWYVQTFGAMATQSAQPRGLRQRRLPGLGMNFSPAADAGGRHAGARDGSHRLRGEGARGVHQEARGAGDQADLAVPAGAGARHLDRVHHRSLGHLHRAD